MQGGQLRAENTQSFRRDAIRLPALLGCKWLDPTLLLQAGDRSIQCSRTQAGSAHVRDVFDHGVPVLRAICEAGKHKQGRIGIAPESRAFFGLYCVLRTSHNVVVSQLVSYCKRAPHCHRVRFENRNIRPPCRALRCNPHQAYLAGLLRRHPYLLQLIQVVCRRESVLLHKR